MPAEQVDDDRLHGVGSPAHPETPRSFRARHRAGLLRQRAVKVRPLQSDRLAGVVVLVARPDVDGGAEHAVEQRLARARFEVGVVTLVLRVAGVLRRRAGLAALHDRRRVEAAGVAHRVADGVLGLETPRGLVEARAVDTGLRRLVVVNRRVGPLVEFLGVTDTVAVGVTLLGVRSVLDLAAIRDAVAVGVGVERVGVGVVGVEVDAGVVAAVQRGEELLRVVRRLRRFDRPSAVRLLVVVDGVVIVKVRQPCLQLSTLQINRIYSPLSLSTSSNRPIDSAKSFAILVSRQPAVSA